MGAHGFPQRVKKAAHDAHRLPVAQPCRQRG